jgi:hypothetical protein
MAAWTVFVLGLPVVWSVYVAEDDIGGKRCAVTRTGLPRATPTLFAAGQPRHVSTTAFPRESSIWRIACRFG